MRKWTAAYALLPAIPNALSLARLALGISFPWLPPDWRPAALVAAALSDAADGAAARLLHAGTRVGRILDPVADKVFVLLVVATLVGDGLLGVGESVLIGLRDGVVVLGAGWLLLRQDWVTLTRVRARPLGKMTTAAQFVFLLLLVCRQRLALVLLATAVLSGLAALDYLWTFGHRPTEDG
jgi:phosphatidylglycerophosphate synthase